MCILVPNETFGPIYRVYEQVHGHPETGYLQFQPNLVGVLRTEGETAGQLMSGCGRIAEDDPSDENSGGFWCTVDIASGLGVVFNLDYNAAGELTEVDFWIDIAPDNTMLDGSTIGPIFHDVPRTELRAGVFLEGSEAVLGLRLTDDEDHMVLMEPSEVLGFFNGLRDDPEDILILIETGDPETGPYAQAEISADNITVLMTELDLLENSIRRHRGL